MKALEPPERSKLFTWGTVLATLLPQNFLTVLPAFLILNMSQKGRILGYKIRRSKTNQRDNVEVKNINAFPPLLLRRINLTQLSYHKANKSACEDGFAPPVTSNSSLAAQSASLLLLIQPVSQHGLYLVWLKWSCRGWFRQAELNSSCSMMSSGSRIIDCDVLLEKIWDNVIAPVWHELSPMVRKLGWTLYMHNFCSF